MLAPLTKELKNEKFTAEWEAKTITLTFDSNGGSTINPVTAKFGTDVPAIAEPVKEGYTFTAGRLPYPKPCRRKTRLSLRAGKSTATRFLSIPTAEIR